MKRCIGENPGLPWSTSSSSQGVVALYSIDAERDPSLISPKPDDDHRATHE